MANISAHYANDRLVREQVIKALGKGYIVKEYPWDRGHKDGAEIHKVYSTGVVEIYNAITGKLVTKIVSTPHQIEIYFDYNKAPWWLVDKARDNKRKGYCI